MYYNWFSSSCKWCSDTDIFHYVMYMGISSHLGWMNTLKLHWTACLLSLLRWLNSPMSKASNRDELTYPATHYCKVRMPISYCTSQLMMLLLLWSSASWWSESSPVISITRHHHVNHFFNVRITHHYCSSLLMLLLLLW